MFAARSDSTVVGPVGQIDREVKRLADESAIGLAMKTDGAEVVLHIGERRQGIGCKFGKA